MRSRSDSEIAGEAEDGNQAIEKILALKPDLVVLDLSMPGKDGLAVLREIAQPDFAHKPKVLILTMHESMELGSRIKSSGGHGYVIKTHAARDLNRAIDTILEGGTFFDGIKTKA